MPDSVSSDDSALHPGADLDFDALQTKVRAAARQRGFEPQAIARIGGDDVTLWTRESTRSHAPRVFVSAGIHGDEPAGALAAAHFLSAARLPEGFDWIIAPILNPSGLRRGTRENADGIDLNRDFLRRRSAETAALVNWWERQPRGCDLHLSLHEDWETSGFYFYAINSGPLPCFSTPLQQSLEQVLPLQETGPVDGHALLKPGLIAHACEADEPEGWPEAIWLGKRYPVLSYTFEAPSAMPLAERVNGLDIALQTAVALFRKTAAEQR